MRAGSRFLRPQKSVTVAVLASILGLLGIPVGVYFASLCARGGVSVWGWGWLAVYVLLDVAAFSAQNNPQRARFTLGAAVALLALILGVRNARVHPMPLGTTVMLPSERPGPWIDRLGEDGDLGMMVFVAMGDFGGVRADDRRRAKPYLRAAWARMRRDPEFAPIPSPIVSNLLSRTSATNLHTLVLNPPQAKASRAVIFLPGTGGSSKLPCYLLARRMPDAMIVCPTMGMSGEWANEEGEVAWNNVLTYTRNHAEMVYVIGEGYGGRALLHLLSRNLLGHLSGAVLLSGYEEAYFDPVRRSSIPLLILRGDEDARTPAFRVEGLAGLDRVQNVELSAGHYLLYEQEDAVLETLDNFCSGR